MDVSPTVLLLVVAAGALAYVNGANDNSKGVATLVGARLSTYPRALAWGTAWTVAGGLAALVVSSGLVKTFSTALVTGDVAASPRFSLAIAAASWAWVLLASRLALPVSTTHALTGAIVGAAVAGGGVNGVEWALLAGVVVLPLAFSPLASALLAYAMHAIFAWPMKQAARYCVCVEEGRRIVLASAGGAAQYTALSQPVVATGAGADCDAAGYQHRLPLTTVAHWGASAALSFARGLNDTPKIIAIAALVGASSAASSASLFVLGALMMGLGGYLSGRRVTHTLAERVTTIDPLEGLSASAVASGLVLTASWLTLPVSTTHVSSGAIVGAGLRGGACAVSWRTVSTLGAAWVITVPVAALLGFSIYTLLW
jgi:PiT family inorganic phosphate transporter